MVFCNSVKNTALTHLPEERNHHGVASPRHTWQREKSCCSPTSSQSLLQLLLPSKGCTFLPLPTLQNTVNLKNKRRRLAGISNSVIKDGGNFSLPGLIEQAADEDSFLTCCQQLR